MRLQSAQMCLVVFLVALFAAPPSGLAQEANAPSDHNEMVGHLAVGYLGWRDIAHGTVNNRVSAPVIGVRYWISRLIGIDGGFGFGIESGEVKIDSAGTTTTTDVSGPTVFVFHGGLPISLATGGHFNFQVVPEFNLGLSSQTIEGGSTDGVANVEVSGFHFDIGARIGAEIHFGFIDVPQLSLQGSVGLFFLSESADTEDRGTDVIATESRSIFSTTVYDNPWNIFIANVAAFYYF